MKTTLLYFKIIMFWALIGLIMPQQLYAQQVSVKTYIEAHREKAVHYMEKYGIPASIILGIAIHESAGGNSRLARYLNNHFGIKGKNNSKVIKSAYKGYDSVDDSYEDFIGMMRNRKQYQPLFDKYDTDDFRNWARGIARGGYAASRTWTAQVINIINKYELYQFDHQSHDSEGIEPALNTYVVKKGDTLSGIAAQFDTTVSDLLDKNGLTSTNLQIGQQLDL